MDVIKWPVTCPAGHQLARAGGVSRSYDANGNTISGIGDGFLLGYNDRNRLAGAYQPMGFDAWSYGYNGNGERVAKRHVTNGIAGPIELSDTRYVYNQGGQLLGEYDDTGAVLAEYIYLGTLPVAVAKGCQLYYILTDHLDTPRQVIDPATSTPVWQWGLLGSAFGVHAADEDADQDGKVFTLNLRFPGQYFDAETGLHYNYFRDYEPATGRYIESDPIGLLGGVNTCLYGGASPLRFFDKRGLRVCNGHWAQIAWEHVFLYKCQCVWLCIPYDSEYVWSGVAHDISLPRTSGNLVAGDMAGLKKDGDGSCNKPDEETGCKGCSP